MGRSTIVVREYFRARLPLDMTLQSPGRTSIRTPSAMDQREDKRNADPFAHREMRSECRASCRAQSFDAANLGARCANRVLVLLVREHVKADVLLHILPGG
jgi:hypothetical protein